MKRVYNRTKTYEVCYDSYHDCPVYVDIVDDGECFHVWLYCGNHGMKTYMFGLPHEQPHMTEKWEGTLREAKRIVTANIENVPSYVRTYWEETDALEAYWEDKFSSESDDDDSDDDIGCPYCNS